MTHSPVILNRSHDDRLAEVTLSAGRGNVIDRRAAGALLDALNEVKDGRHLHALLLRAEGDHFSFGASVAEHGPETVAALLAELHAVVVALLRFPVPVLAAVRGACLGGGLELVLPAERIFAGKDAKLGLPEVTLGMFAPAGSVLLPARVRRPVADDLLLSGRAMEAEEAERVGLVDEVCLDPDAAALAWFEEHLMRHSAGALRAARLASRGPFVEWAVRRIQRLERTFLYEVAPSHDALEGIEAFEEKRTPVWTDA